MLFTLVNTTGNVQKIVKDARKRDELIRQGYVEILPEGEESEQEETTLPPEGEESEQEETTLPPEGEESEQEEEEPKEEHEPEPEVKPEPEAKPAKAPRKKTDDKE